MILRALASAAAGLIGGSLALATPALAHGGEAPDGTDYRTQVTGIVGSLPGVSVRAIEAGARLELVNDSGQTVEVLGYQGEPYLEVRPDGVYENLNSPATYLNETMRGGKVPARANPAIAPSWRRANDKPRARWHDHRTHWMSAKPPPPVAAAPQRQHRIRDWVVPLRTGVHLVEVRGTLDYVPPPTAGAWWAGVVLGAATVGTLGLVPPRRRRAVRAVRGALSSLATVGGLAAIGYAIARELDAGSSGLGVLSGLLAGQLWPVLAGLGMIAAGGYAVLRRPPAADFALALAGACLALFAGVTNASVLGRGVAPVPFAAQGARLAVATLIVVGAGLTIAGSLRLRAFANQGTNRPNATVDSGATADSDAMAGKDDSAGSNATPGTDDRPGTNATPGTDDRPGTNATPGTDDRPRQ